MQQHQHNYYDGLVMGHAGHRPADMVRTLVFSLPLNTAQAGGKVPRDLVTLPYDISFIDFRDRVCVEMGLDPQEAELGYKFHNHRVRDSPIRLAKEDDLRVAISTAQGMVRRARSKEIHIIIHNLDLFIRAPAAYKKRRRAGVDDDRSNAVSRVPTKKPRTTSPSNDGNLSNQNHSYMSDIAAPLNHQNDQRIVNATNPDSPIPPGTSGNTCNPIIYPTIGDVLLELHSEMPDANIPMYEIGLQQYGVFFLEEAEGLHALFLEHEVGMPAEIIQPFQDHIERLLGKAKE